MAVTPRTSVFPYATMWLMKPLNPSMSCLVENDTKKDKLKSFVSPSGVTNSLARSGNIK